MKVTYRKLFVKDLHALRGSTSYEKLKTMAFETLPACRTIGEVPGIKPLRQRKDAFRIGVGEYRIGLKRVGDTIEVMRVLNRKDFYRYFP